MSIFYNFLTIRYFFMYIFNTCQTTKKAEMPKRHSPLFYNIFTLPILPISAAVLF